MEQIMQVYQEGESYYNRLVKMNLDTLKLGSEVVFNLVCMSIEAMLSAFLLNCNEKVEHGSISAMLRAASKHTKVSEELIDEGRFINRFHTWCALDAVPSKKATSDELKRMLGTVKEIRMLVKSQLELNL